MTDNDIITGSWCSGSTRNEDLLPPHIEAVKRILEWSEGRDKVDQDELEKAHRELEEITRRVDLSGDSYFNSEESTYDLDILNVILNQFAPEGYYWGSHEGDPTDVGYWKHD